MKDDRVHLDDAGLYIGGDDVHPMMSMQETCERWQNWFALAMTGLVICSAGFAVIGYEIGRVSCR